MTGEETILPISSPACGGGPANGREGGLLFHLREGPIEPGRQRFDIGCFHGGATPDAQTRRRGAIAADVESDIFLFQKACDLRGSFSLRLLGQSSEPRIDDLETR